ncbi:MAG TPA: Uma2 family endonuclease, partial [Pirellulales bacterium]|nr:Uma2 family endonuclease [Pirellulales bacterium]
MLTINTPPPGTVRDPLYPDSDGQPMGETGFHVSAIVYLISALRQHFHGRQDVYVGGDMFLYYEKGNPAACKAPDVMYIKGVRGNHERRSFRTWEEGVAPTVIFEITSSGTRRNDQVSKPRVYAKLGVPEYFVFDPEREYLSPPLQGFRLKGKRYVPIEADHQGRFISDHLAMAVAAEGYLPRLIDLKTGTPLPTMKEQAALAAKAERATKKAEQATKKAERATRQARGQIKKAEQAAEAERRRVAELEAELAQLRA